MVNLSQQTLDFIVKHRRDDVRQIALHSNRYTEIDINEAITQISGWQIANKKIPSWANKENIIYPKHLSMEQCSSETTAKYKMLLAEGNTLADLTAGLGVDCSFMATRFKHVHYVERQEELCNIAKHNFKILGLNRIKIHNEDGIEFLKKMDKVDCIFLDPARRNNHGGKTVAINDCDPNVKSIENMLIEKGDIIIIKLSPMLDIHTALNELKHIKSLHVVSVNNECKELIIILTQNSHTTDLNKDDIKIECEQIINDSSSQHLTFTYSEEKAAEINYADHIGNYLYEPGAALLKAGPFKLLSTRYGVKKLHPNSHLYTSGELKDFPGRQFKVIGISTFNKKELKDFLNDIDKANITIRNFPSTVADLRKKLKLKEGGGTYIFATTLGNNKILIKCKSVKSFISQ